MPAPNTLIDQARAAAGLASPCRVTIQRDAKPPAPPARASLGPHLLAPLGDVSLRAAQMGSRLRSCSRARPSDALAAFWSWPAKARRSGYGEGQRPFSRTLGVNVISLRTPLGGEQRTLSALLCSERMSLLRRRRYA